MAETLVINALYEAGLTLLISLSGVSLAWVFGLRHPALLAVVGFSSTIILRTATFLSLAIFPSFVDSQLVWVGLSMAAVIFGVVLAKFTRNFWLAVATSWAIGLAAVAAKFGLGIGERHHEDSVQIVANSLLIFAEDEVATRVKRGLAMPLMLNLGLDGTIFASFTPMVFGHLLLLVVWFGKKLLKPHGTGPLMLVIIVLLGLVSVSTPMIRALVFYLNSHTMVALGVSLILMSNLEAVRSLTIGRKSSLLVLVGGLLITWSRFEGFAIFLLVVAPMLTFVGLNRRRDKIRLWFAIQIPLWGWYLWAVLSSTSIPIFGHSLLFIVPLVLGGLTALVLLPVVDRYRHFLLPVFILSLATFVVIYVWGRTGNIEAQLRNLVLGAGGWGFVAPAFLMLLILIGLQGRSRQYRALLGSVTIAILGTIAIKALDSGGGSLGGLGQQGFNDSINRAWSHWLALWWWVPALGLAELVGQVRQKAHRQRVPPRSNQREHRGSKPKR